MFDVGWLSQPVPLWAFLVAMLTAPWTWAQRITNRIGPLLDRTLASSGGES